MPDDKPTPWPPAPAEGKETVAKPPLNLFAGRVSFVLSLVALLSIVPIIMFPPVFILASFVFGTVSLIFGIAGRETLLGKIGLGISFVTVILGAIALLWLSGLFSFALVSVPFAPPGP